MALPTSISGTRGSGDGKAGWAVPFSGDGRGRVAQTFGNDQLEKLIATNLQDLSSGNPFQELGIGEDMVFAVAAEHLRIDLRRRIRALFKRLQLADRARLAKEPDFNVNATVGELTINIDYINIEEDKPGSMSFPFRLRASAPA
jgi:hypothetical protein